MKPDQIAKEAITLMNRKITDLVFLEIQNNRELMQKYLRCVENEGLNKTNQEIGKAVKSSFNLNNLDERQNDPISTLIQSHQIFDNP